MVLSMVDAQTTPADTEVHGPATAKHRTAAQRLAIWLARRTHSRADADLLDAVAPGESTQRGRAAASVAAVAEHLSD